MTLAFAALTGVGIGFLGGLRQGWLGDRDSVAARHRRSGDRRCAAPLPATIPSTMVASYAYSRERLVDWRVVRCTATFGVPATVLGAWSTRWISGGILVKVTDVVLVGLGIWILAGP
jgi:uncharacterized membrane protein YfcA